MGSKIMSLISATFDLLLVLAIFDFAKKTPNRLKGRKTFNSLGWAMLAVAILDAIVNLSGLDFGVVAIYILILYILTSIFMIRGASILKQYESCDEPRMSFKPLRVMMIILAVLLLLGSTMIIILFVILGDLSGLKDDPDTGLEIIFQILNIAFTLVLTLLFFRDSDKLESIDK